MPGFIRSPRKDKRHSPNPRVRNIRFTSGPTRLSGGGFSRQTTARSVVVREVEFSSPGWPEEFDGLRIAHLSDCHLGRAMSFENAERMIEEIATREPDFIAGTGNVIDLQDPHSRTLPPDQYLSHPIAYSATTRSGYRNTSSSMVDGMAI